MLDRSAKQPADLALVKPDLRVMFTTGYVRAMSL